MTWVLHVKGIKVQQVQKYHCYSYSPLRSLLSLKYNFPNFCILSLCIVESGDLSDSSAFQGGVAESCNLNFNTTRKNVWADNHVSIRKTVCMASCLYFWSLPGYDFSIYLLQVSYMMNT